MSIEYRVNAPVDAETFIALLKASTLAERRPVEDRDCIEGMLRHGNLTVTAWDDRRLVGIARSVTDFHYACYLSDLAVDVAYQKRGIGTRLQALTQDQLGPRCKIILVAAPAANAYYEHVGFSHNPRCWVLERGVRLG
ncbi:MAG: GNAT family N-acetyltransferase [Chromatiales bacterium]|nr:GNAT family N-acetyltransferase [Chromatiales bacterium]